jgi:dihydrofolate synthase/folylpolyglutamate synthase
MTTKTTDATEKISYEEAMKYIKDCTKFGIKLGLGRMQAILARLGHPEKQFPIVHVAGTNGKGSTVALFDAVFRAAGYKTGRFTSPHLVSYRERFVVDDALITKDQLAARVAELKPVIAAVTVDGYGAPTEFEVGTALAFSYFARRQVEVAVVEVGMGGRFDSTNVVEPTLCVITHIALDHQEYLGETLKKIAFEKAGIIKPGVPVVIGVQEPEIAAYLAQIAADRGAAWVQAGDLPIDKIAVGESGTSFTAVSPVFGELPVNMGLIGRHQVDNCRNVLAGMAFLAERGLPVSREQLLTGLAQAVWPGRLERMAGVARPRLFFDGSHNPDGIRALVDTLKTLFPGQKIDFLFGKLANRPSEEMVAILAEVARRAIATTVPYGKTTSAADLAVVFQKYGVPARSEPDPATALELLLQTGNPIAVATGSFYLTGFLRSVLYRLDD